MTMSLGFLPGETYFFCNACDQKPYIEKTSFFDVLPSTPAPEWPKRDGRTTTEMIDDETTQDDDKTRRLRTEMTREDIFLFQLGRRKN